MVEANNLPHQKPPQRYLAQKNIAFCVAKQSLMYLFGQGCNDFEDGDGGGADAFASSCPLLSVCTAYRGNGLVLDEAQGQRGLLLQAEMDLVGAEGRF